LTSGKDWPELREQLARSIEKEKRGKQLLIAIFLQVVALVLMAVGIVIIGKALEDLADRMPEYAFGWNPLNLEVGLFLALVGAIMTALFGNHLAATWRALKTA